MLEFMMEAEVPRVSNAAMALREPFAIVPVIITTK